MFFLTGFLVCDLYVTRQAEWKPNFLWDALALCLGPLNWYPGRTVGHIVLPFVIVVLHLAAFRGRICSAAFSNRVIINIGGMCYSIYLFHVLIIYFVKHMTFRLQIGQNFWFHYFLQACMIVPVVLLLCGAFFVLIERPCMDKEWPQKLWRFVHTLRTSSIRGRRLQGDPARSVQGSRSHYALTNDPIFSPSTTRRILPRWFRLKTMMGRSLSLHSEMAVESITLRPCRRTSM